MGEIFEDLKKDWDKFKEKMDEEDKETDQMYDYTNTASPDQILIESMTAEPAALKAVNEAMKQDVEDMEKAQKKTGE